MKHEDEVQKLSREFNKIRNSGGKIIFPLHLKMRVLSLLRENYPMLSLCERLNLRAPQVYSWKSQVEQEHKANPKSPYEIKTIPVISSISSSENQDLKQSKKIRPKIFFRFFSLKISLG